MYIISLYNKQIGKKQTVHVGEVQFRVQGTEIYSGLQLHHSFPGS